MITPRALSKPRRPPAKHRAPNLLKPRLIQRVSTPKLRPSRIFNDDSVFGSVSRVLNAQDDADSDNLSGNTDASDEEDESHLFLDWDEEHTLVSTLLEDGGDEQDSGCKISLLTEKLPQLYADQARFLKEDMINTILPAISRVKSTHTVLKNTVDVKMGDGILAFDAACKRVEARFAQQLEKTRAVVGAVEARMAKLQSQLNDAYTQRVKLWNQFEQDFEEIATALAEEYDHLTVDGDRIIESAEKKLKKRDREEEGKISKAKLLESMLKKL